MIHPIRRLSVLAVVLLLSVGTVMAHSTTTQTDEPKEYDEATWTVDLESMRSAIDAGEPVEVLLGDLGTHPVILQEFDVFAPGHKKVVFIDENGTVLREEPITYWSFQGRLVGSSEQSVLLTMDDRGLYGHVNAFDTQYLYEPIDEDHVLAQGESAEVRVKWLAGTSPSANALSELEAMLDDQDALQPSSSQSGVQSGGTNVEAGASTIGSSSTKTGWVWPLADWSFRATHSNYATRIGNAYAAQHSMWADDINLYHAAYGVSASPNYSSSSDCNTHLNDFTNSVPRYSSVDAYQLFTGKDLDGCIGISNPPRDSNNNLWPGHLAENPDSVVEAVDHSYWDLYDPDETTTDLGLVSGHEVGHNWGEPYHHWDWDGTYNIMVEGGDPDSFGFWFTTTSSFRIGSATNAFY